VEHGLLCEVDTTSIINKFVMAKSMVNAIVCSRLLLLTIDFDIHTEITLSGSVVLYRVTSLANGASTNFRAGWRPYALCNMEILINKFTKKYMCFYNLFNVKGA